MYGACHQDICEAISKYFGEFFQVVLHETEVAVDSDRSEAAGRAGQLHRDQSEVRHQTRTKHSGIFHCRVC